MRSLIVCLALLLLLGPHAKVFAAASCDPWVARVVSLQGQVEARRAGTDRWQAAELHGHYCHGDRFRILTDSRAAIELSNDTVLRLDQKTTLILPEAPPERGLWVELVEGALHLISRVRHSLEIRTPFVNAGLEGTEFVVRVLEAETRISVIEGRVAFNNPFGRLSLTAGQSASAARGRAPVLRLDLRPEDAVHWALYYPAILERDDAPLARAQRALAVGRVAQAESLVSERLDSDGGEPDAWALRSVISLAQNDKSGALAAARRALELAPGSAAAHLAMSYARQAHFDLPGARTAVEAALQTEPDNALAWARLAELSASLGEVEASRAAAERAAELRPGLARAQAVLGFTHLIGFELDAARGAFERAIEADSGDPLPRLGLGLARIRQGALAEGRRELEIAASLDPGNSLIRSYLGKAYFEEDRYGVAQNEFDLARRLDPLDPTPWLYQAMLAQAENRPVAALESLEKSVELNDNRAVTRSSFALDQDLAVRTAATARVYDHLGFDQLALQRGRQAVAADPSDYSAHRFLADAYASQPRHEIARVSELYQSQMLQPLNINLIQPQLAVSDLGIIRGTGPSSLSFSEFTPMFLSEGTYFQSNLLLGGFGTEGLDVLFSGLHGKAAYSMGHFYYKTDGFNTNNAQDQSLLNAFVQGQVSESTSLQAEVRVRERDLGDPIWFFDSNIRPDRKEIDNTRVRIGARHSFSPNSVLLGAVRVEDVNSIETISIIPFLLTSHIDVDAQVLIGEGRYIFKDDSWGFTAGFSHAQTDYRTQVANCSLFLGCTPQPVKQQDWEHTNVYAYALFEPVRSLELTAGISTDLFDNLAEGTDRINGKLGFVWAVMPSTVLRAAATQGLSKTELSDVVVGDQTLEPTHVSGFNQFFQEIPGSRSQRLGIAIDQRFSSRMFGGLEWSERRIRVPDTDVTSGSIVTAEKDEYLGRAYLYYGPSESIALSVQYSYEELDRSQNTGVGPGGFSGAGSEAIVESTTHRVPVELTYVYSSTISGRVRATYVQQVGEFVDRTPPLDPFADPTEKGSDRFWTFDAGLDYRLPRRSGMVSVGIENAFDEDFRFQDTDPANPTISPRQFVYARLSLSF